MADIIREPPSGGQPLVRVGRVATPEDVVRRLLERRSKHTQRAYGRDLDHFAAWLHVESRQTALRALLTLDKPRAAALVLDYMNAMDSGAASATGTPASTATMARRLSTLKQAVKVAGLTGVVTWDLKGIEAPKVEAFRDTKGPGRESLSAMIAKVREEADPIVRARNEALLLVFTGMALRRGEIASLRLEHYERGRLSVLGKKRTEREWMTVPEAAAQAIDRWLALRPSDEAAPLEKRGGLFVSLDAKHFGWALTGDGIYYIIRAIGRACEIKVWPHAIRHAAITAVLDETNGNVRVGQRFARHAKAETTMKYDDNRQDLGAEAGGRVLDAILPKAPEVSSKQKAVSSSIPKASSARTKFEEKRRQRLERLRRR